MKESKVYEKRKELGIKRVYKCVDTCAAEFAAATPYYYSTFNTSMDNPITSPSSATRKKVVVLGSGPNRIGQGIEFDYSCVHGVLAAKEAGYETIMINCNPETVSTDPEYFGQTVLRTRFLGTRLRHHRPRKTRGRHRAAWWPNGFENAEKLDKYGIKIIGTSYQALDLAEDRGRFSNLLRELEIPYPEFGTVRTSDAAVELSRELGFPLLVRPSYVLGGQSMKIVINEQELEQHVVKILHDIPDNNILLDHFLEGAIEAKPTPSATARTPNHRRHGAHRTGGHPLRRLPRCAAALRSHGRVYPKN